MYLDRIIFFKETPLKDLNKDSEEHKALLTIREKLIIFEHILKEYPEGQIIYTPETSIAIIGFPEEIAQDVQQMLLS